MLNFDVEEKIDMAVIKVIGAGGGGNNAVDRMIGYQGKGVSYTI